jgi:hypothetical protein
MNAGDQSAAAARGKLRSGAASIRIRCGAVEETAAHLTREIDAAVARLASISQSGGTVDARHLETLERQAADLVESATEVVTAVANLVRTVRTESRRVREIKTRGAADGDSMGHGAG